MKTCCKFLVIGLSIWLVLLKASQLSKALSILCSTWEESLQFVVDSERAIAQDLWVEDTQEHDHNEGNDRSSLARENKDTTPVSNSLRQPSTEDDHHPRAIPASEKHVANPRDKQSHKKTVKELKKELEDSIKQARDHSSIESPELQATDRVSMNSQVQSPTDASKRGANTQTQSQITTTKRLAGTVLNEQKPRLIVHIGPSKTGTSTIQRESSNHFAESLEKDDYFYVGKFANKNRRFNAKIPNLFDANECFKEAAIHWRETGTNQFTESECWRERVAGVQEYWQKNQSLVLSDESYSYVTKYAGWIDPPDHVYYGVLRAAFQDWDVLIVPTYRRYFEWIASVAKEVNRKGCHQPTVEWTKRKCMNLWEKVTQMLHLDDFRGHPYTNLDVTVPTWRNAGFNVSILNFHSERHLTCAFYCDVIPNAPNTCEFCLKQASERHNQQEVSMTAYNDIVFEAAKRGIVNTEEEKRSRHEVTKDLANYHGSGLGKVLADLPLICPKRKVLQTLLNKSLVLEKRLLPELFRSPQGETEHRAAFWRMVEDEKAFCWVDTGALLNATKSWEQVLDLLKNWPERTEGTSQ